jgi:hypothetical protein
MITVSGFRNSESGTHYFPTQVVSPANALADLVSNELGFGGTISTITPRSITVTTPVRSGMIDTISFSGGQIEMRNIIHFCHFFLLTVAEHDELAIASASAASVNLTGGNTALLALAAPMLIGTSRVNLALLLSLGISETEIFSAMVSIATPDLLAAIQLAEEMNIPVTQALELAH